MDGHTYESHSVRKIDETLISSAIDSFSPHGENLVAPSDSTIPSTHCGRYSDSPGVLGYYALRIRGHHNPSCYFNTHSNITASSVATLSLLKTLRLLTTPGLASRIKPMIFYVYVVVFPLYNQ